MKTKISVFFPLLSVVCLLLAMSARATSYTLTVTAQGSGTITTNPVFATYPANVTVGLTATPNTGWYFAGWSGDAGGTTNEVNVTMTGNLSVTGLFLAYPVYSLTLATNGQGSIALNPPGGTYYSNTVVTATASAAAGWVFAGWSDATNATTGAVSLALDSDLTLTGTFAQLPAFDVQPLSITNKVGSTVSFSSHSVGTAPVAYQWYFSDEPISGATNDVLTLGDATATEAGFYEVAATNLYGSATSSVVALVLTNASYSTNVVTVCDEAGLQAAIRVGGWISIGCSGTITLTNTLTITNHVILDGSGVSAIISGGNAVQLFYVQPGASLAITNLTLANGSCIVTNGSAPAAGGAIYNNGGMVTLTGCTLTNNSALAEIPAGIAQGGAIYNNGGTVGLYGSVVLNNTAFGNYNTYPSFGGNGGQGLGGAIFNTNGTLAIVGSLLESNLCSNVAYVGNVKCLGGALFQASGALFITNTILAANQALGGTSDGSSFPAASPAYGGAVAAMGGRMTLDLCQLVGNTSQGGNGTGDSPAAAAFGGAVYCSNTLTVVRCSFSGNQALAGTPSFNYGFLPVSASASGGAIYNLGTVVLRNSLVCSNDSLGGTGYGPGSEGPGNGGDSGGGGIFNAGQISATNSTIALNTAIGGQGTYLFGSEGEPAVNGFAIGGGVFNATNATFLGVNVTIASNLCNALSTATYTPAGGAFVDGFAVGSQIANTNGTVSLLNSLLAYGSTNGNAYGEIIDLGDNISSDGSADFASGSSYNYTDPLLGPLANNGGLTLTMALDPESPAIGYANSGDGAPPDDQRGYARPMGIGVIDLGAYQSSATQIYYPPPTLSLSIAEAFPNVVVSFTTSPAITNTLHFQSSTNLINWIDVQIIGALASPSNISETISQQGVSRKFFRLMW